MGVAAEALTSASSPDRQRISGAFQLLLGMYIILTGDFPTVVQALAFGLEGGAGTEFAAAMVTSFARDLLLLAPVVVLASHPLGILHPLLLAAIVWPLLTGMASVIEQFGGWGGIIAGLPLATPYFVGLPSHNATTVWTAMAKYNGLEILALVSTYFGFWFFRTKRNFVRIPVALPSPLAARTVLLGLLAVSVVALLAYLYLRGGLGSHLTSLGRGRFRELAGAGFVMVLTDLGALAIYLWVAARPGDLKSPLFLTCLAVVIANQFISNGSRGSALIVPLMVGLIWALRRQKVPWKVALVLAPMLFLALGLLSAVRTSSWEGSTAGEALMTTGWTESFTRAQEEMAQRRALSANVPVVERGSAVSNGLLLGESYVGAVTAFVPRALWEDKPRGAGSLYAQLFLGEQKEGRGIPVSSAAETYWNFGLPGVVLLSILYGSLLRAVYHFYWRRYPDPFAIVFYVLFLTTFDFSTKRLVAFEQQLVLLLVCYVAFAILVPKQAPATNLIRNGLPVRRVSN